MVRKRAYKWVLLVIYEVVFRRGRRCLDCLEDNVLGRLVFLVGSGVVYFVLKWGYFDVYFLVF